jgi:hypothetical protein
MRCYCFYVHNHQTAAFHTCMLLPDLASAIREAHEAICIGTICATQDCRFWWIEIKDEEGAVVFSYPFVSEQGRNTAGDNCSGTYGLGERVQSMWSAVTQVFGRIGLAPRAESRSFVDRPVLNTPSHSRRPWLTSLLENWREPS